MRKTLSLVLASLFFTACFAQTDDSLFIRRLADEILINGNAYENLRVLTKGIGGRIAGSPAMVKAERWGLQAMKDAKADAAWLQECNVPHWVRGGRDDAAYTVGKNGKPVKLEVLALGNSMGTGANGLSAPAILIHSFEELEQKKADVRGKIVFYNYKFNSTFIRTGQAYGDAVRYRGGGASRAAKYGAVGVLVRSMTHATDNHPHTGAMNYNDSFAKIPALAVGIQDADRLAKAINEHSNVQLFLKSNAKMLPDTIGHNVIGELRGTEFPDQYITIGGHLDSWDPAEGAHDDGAGCVQTIEILRAYKALGYQPKRTIRFVLFANEENGLRGGTQYAAEAARKAENHFFALESDAGGFTPRGFGFTIGADSLKKMRQWLPLLLPYGVYEFNQGGGGADIGPLNRTFGTPLAGLQPDSQRYFDVHHARSDVFEAVNKRELELGAINMAALIYLVDKYGW